ncbi:MAG: PAS domain S-box protein, partial [Deltaproteobacteria bacterium]|nr:PAS domain S-box protein [Deltaproteobacteria bacterium]
KSDIAYKNIYDLLSKEEADVCVAGNREVFEKKRRVHTEELIKNGKGELRLLAISKTPRLDKDGNVEYVVCSAEDITDRKRVDEAIQKSEKRYRMLVETMNDGLGVLDENGAITHVNDQLCEMTGYSRDEIIGRSVPDFLDPDFLQIWQEQPTRQQLSEGERYELGMVCKDGQKRYVLVSPKAILDSDGNFQGSFAVITDITNRKRAEDALQGSEARYRSLVENINDLIFSVDMKGSITYISPVVQRMMGYSPSEVVGRQFKDFLHPEDLSVVTARFQELLSGKIAPNEYRVLTKAGEVRWVRSSSRPVFEGNSVVGVNGVLTDITDRRRAEERLRASEERFRGLFDQSNDAVFIHSLDGQILDVNRRTCEMLGYERQKLLELSIPELHPEDSLYESRKAFEAAEDTGSVLFESAFKKADGTIIDVEISSRVVDPKEGIVQGIVRDITERKRSEQALRDSESQLRALGSRLSEVEEIERKELARELHDRVGQNLTALGINLNVVNNYLQDEAREKVGSRLDDALKQVEETARDIRDVMSELRPPVLDDYGLMAALRWFCKQFSERTGISVAMQGEELTSRLSIALEIGLFRIAQEALTNVSKHARANHIAVTLDRVAGGVRLVIADDGQGFDAESVRWTSEDQKWGLLTMRERAAAAGGTFHIKSDPGQGTEIVVEVRG